MAVIGAGVSNGLVLNATMKRRVCWTCLNCNLVDALYNIENLSSIQQKMCRVWSAPNANPKTRFSVSTAPFDFGRALGIFFLLNAAYMYRFETLVPYCRCDFST